MKVFGTYRPKQLSSPYNIDGTISMNGKYTPAFFLNGQFADYGKAGLTNILDMEIPEENYTTEIAPGIKKLTRFIVGEYNETYVDGAEFTKSMQSVGAEFQIEAFATPALAIVWIKANTNLIERTHGVFIIAPAGIDIMGAAYPEKLLTVA